MKKVISFVLICLIAINAVPAFVGIVNAEISLSSFSGNVQIIGGGITDYYINVTASSTNLGIFSTTTDSNGNYIINVVAGGYYDIFPELPIGCVVTYPTVGSYTSLFNEGGNYENLNFTLRCDPVCGDGAVNQTSEECDAGLGVDSEICTNECEWVRWCGDDECNNGETCDTCSNDCGQCEPYCGDGICDSGESCSTCSSDCGECKPKESPPGGGGGGLPIFKIVYKGECVVGQDGIAHFDYRTNMPGFTRVVCDKFKHMSMGIAPFYDFLYHTETLDEGKQNEVTLHTAELELSMDVGMYFCRVISGGSNSWHGEVKEELECEVPKPVEVLGEDNLESCEAPGYLLPEDRWCWYENGKRVCWKNNPETVRWWKDFFNWTLEGKYGIFDDSVATYTTKSALFHAMVKFQEEYPEDIFGIYIGDHEKIEKGNAYRMTRLKAASIKCGVDLDPSQEDICVINDVNQKNGRNDHKELPAKDIPPIVILKK